MFRDPLEINAHNFGGTPPWEPTRSRAVRARVDGIVLRDLAGSPQILEELSQELV